jgi:hypothetical protein
MTDDTAKNRKPDLWLSASIAEDKQRRIKKPEIAFRLRKIRKTGRSLD